MMSMLPDVMLVAAGLALLFWGGDLLVRGAVQLAASLGVSPLVVGIVVVGCGTSAPELVTSVDAALRGSAGIAVGNVVGSNIANILLVLGLTALFLPLACEPGATRRDLLWLLMAAGAGTWALQQGMVQRGAGLLLVLALGIYIVVLVRGARRQRQAPTAAGEAGPAAGGSRPLAATLRALLGIALLVGGAHWLVGGALGLAQAFGVSESVVGLTLVALGTTLPELAAAMVAVLRRAPDVAVGNIVGSTLFNLLGILGVTALVQPLPVPAEIAGFDLWVMIAAMLALVLFARTGWRLSRGEGGVLLAGYPFYLGSLVV